MLLPIDTSRTKDNEHNMCSIIIYTDNNVRYYAASSKHHFRCN